MGFIGSKAPCGLFKVLGFKPPKYAHVSPIMKDDDGGRRNAKRKDPEAAVRYYAEQEYPPMRDGIPDDYCQQRL